MSQKPEKNEVEFPPGSLVSLQAEPAVTGAVVEVLLGKPENRFVVLVGEETRTYYASQLVAVEKQTAPQKVLPLSHFHAHLSALQIQHPGTSTLYSLNAARVDFVPYQFRPVMKFIRAERPRLLIADGVGVGKTIEAGLILRELQARSEVDSALIICPKALVTDRKWELEMKRFDEKFTQLDGPTLRHCMRETDLDGEWPGRHSKTVMPYSLFNEVLLKGRGPGKTTHRRLGLKELDPPPYFDLVIVDEAHHIRNTDTYSHKVVRFFCENAEAVLFLTATPIQMGAHDLFVLLNVLRPDLIVDEESFEYMAQPNEHINRGIRAARGAQPGWEKKAKNAVEDAGRTEWGRAILSMSPDYKDVRDRLSQGQLSPNKRVEIINDLQELHTFSDLINRTRRRDIGEFTTRKPETVRVPFTDDQKAVHDQMLRVQARILSRLHEDIPVKFLMTTIRRQAASCLFGLAPFLEAILTRRIDELVQQEATEAYDIPDMSFLPNIRSEIETVIGKAKRLRGPDRKLEALRGIVTEKQEMENNRVMLFSTFRHTLKYLMYRLGNDGYRITVMHGGTPDGERVRIRERFRLPRENDEALDMVLFSEVACEGLDFEFCDCIVNYDLPWNPMRIEQRIGRIDRHGQASDTVAIYNMITPGTVDAEIYERCLSRIGVFEKALGSNETILGEISQEIHSIAENLELSEEERNARLQQLADNEIREIQEEERLEERQRDLFGIRLPQEELKEEIDDAASYWLSADAIENLVMKYLDHISDSPGGHIQGKGLLKNLRTSREMRETLLDDFRALELKRSETRRQWSQFLRRGNPHLAITFDAECARDNREATFITPVHPVVLQAAEAFGPEKRLYTAFEVEEAEVDPGDYPFAIYEWRYSGLRDQLALRPICEEPRLSDNFLSFLERGDPIDLALAGLPPDSKFDDLDQRHHGEWRQALEEHRADTAEHVAYKRESLKKSYSASSGLLSDKLHEATDENIRRMYISQLEKARRDHTKRLEELDKAEKKADISAQPVAFGIIRVAERGR
ncbi:MAG: DEAD/DEAH box helicase [Candidatus Brocadiia bacterium]